MDGPTLGRLWGSIARCHSGHAISCLLIMKEVWFGCGGSATMRICWSCVREPRKPRDQGQVVAKAYTAPKRGSCIRKLLPVIQHSIHSIHRGENSLTNASRVTSSLAACRNFA